MKIQNVMLPAVTKSISWCLRERKFLTRRHQCETSRAITEYGCTHLTTIMKLLKVVLLIVSGHLQSDVRRYIALRESYLQ